MQRPIDYPQLTPEEVQGLRLCMQLPAEEKERFFTLPPHASRLYLAHDIALVSAKPKPNAWRRFWLWAFFGWRWDNV